MTNLRLLCALLGMLAAGAGIASTARATTIDTFDFSQTGWVFAANRPVPQGLFSGSFTGAVEPGGNINLPDLTAFSAIWSTTSGSQSYGLGSLSLFSFTTTGGPSSFGIIANRGVENGVCVGAPVVLSNSCGNVYAPTAFGTFFSNLSDQTGSLTSSQPTLTLVSSITAPPPGPVPVPEPDAVLVFSSGLLVLASLVYRRSRGAIRTRWHG